MVSEQVCLRWNNFPLNITKNIDDLWKDESLVDVTICSEGQCIQAHKVILSASSPLFKGIFAVNPCQHPVIILQDVRFRELLAIISFIYKGEINIEQQHLPALLKAAKTLQIRGLSDSVGITEEHASFMEKQERPAKKRRVYNTSFSDSNDDETSMSNDQNLIPKKEPDTDELIPPDLATTTSDDEDIKNESTISSEHSQHLLGSDTSANNDSAWYSSPTDESPSPYVAFPCPFCDRAYTCWGYRRRHIKAVHCNINEVSCRWCPKAYFTQGVWMQHIVDKHKLPYADAQQGIEILEEAKKVLHMKNDRPDIPNF